MDETILTWNVTNWITVVIMASLGFLLLALIAQVFHKTRGSGHSQYSTTPQQSTMS
jgi:hypothetical protein